ncbi:MAG: hypothetical protein AAFX05_07525 [Planctomycetota bacterium]
MCLWRVIPVIALCVAMTSCSSYQPDGDVLRLTADGDYGAARVLAADRAVSDPDDRSYMLDRMKMLTLGLADGVPDSVEGVADRLYDFLRTQGVNADAGVATFFVGEGGARIWKGEPYEQAMAYASIAALDGTRGDWGNVRASATNALFLVRDFSEAIERGRGELRSVPPDDALADRQAIAADAAVRSDEPDFVLVDSDFELGYALQAVSNDQLGLAQERDEALERLLVLAPRLEQFADEIRSGAYNAVLYVDYGLGPRKIGAGPNQVFAVFQPRTSPGLEPLRAIVNQSTTVEAQVMTDVVRMAQDVRWNDLEQMRRAKGALGTALLAGGLTALAVADNEWVALGGAIAAVIGGMVKSSAAVDTRHCETLPQRTYIVPVTLQPGFNSIELEIAGRPGTRLILPTVPGPAARAPASMHYVRLVADGSVPPSWAVSGEVRYANDATGSAGPTLPYILGGRCVRTPTRSIVREYHEAGLPRRYLLADVLEMYRAEGIDVVGYTDAAPGLHVLEGGRSLYTPLPGSTGFARLYGREHPSYSSRSELVGRVRAEMGEVADSAVTQPDAMQGE